jgi:hypothetical protein
MTETQGLVLPLLLHLLLTFAVGLLSLRRRIAAVRTGKARLQDIAADSAAWPESTRKFGNNFDNQFQVPMLAYAGVATLLAIGLADWASVVLMWTFIAARLLHTVEHTGRNNVPRRLAFFLVSFASVAALWLWLGLRLFVIG